MPWIVAALGALGARGAHGQSTLDLVNLAYHEPGDRIQVLEQMLLLHQDLGDALGVMDVTLTHDAISGASPTGAYPKVDTTTSASGTASPQGAFPLARDRNHRNAVALAYGRAYGAHLPMVDVSYSKEDDYTAREAGLSDAWTLAEGRGLLHYGASLGSDLSEPITNHLKLTRKSASFALGFTWILGPGDLLDVSGSRTRLTGYLDEPYKVVTVGLGAAPDHRPGVRTRDALIFRYGHYFPWNGAMRTSYRYYTDDWALRAQTLDATYEQRLGPRWTVAPEVRYYTQTKASFYASQFAAPQPYMSADYRLSSFDSFLEGLSASCQLKDSLVLKAGGTFERARGRDRVRPLATGPILSSADLDKATFTLGLSWRY